MYENNMAQKLPNEKVSVNLYWVFTVCLILEKLKCDDVQDLRKNKKIQTFEQISLLERAFHKIDHACG